MNTLVGSLPELEDQLAAAEQARQEAERKATALRQIIEGVRALNGEATEMSIGSGVARVAERRPRGREAIRIIVSERPGRWALTELVEEHKRRGWFTSRKAVEVSVHRLRESGEAKRDGTGVYEFPANVAEVYPE